MNKPHSISTDLALMDRAWAVGAIRASYWGTWQSDEQLETAFANSICFGLHVPGVVPLQIGFARVITDRATVSAITDVIIRDGWRRQGFGKLLIQAVLDHRAVRDTICILDCRPENDGFYAGLGFERKRAIMQRDPR